MIVVFFSLQTDYACFWVDLAFSRNTLEEASGYGIYTWLNGGAFQG